ncbi:LLM class oxidoreductase [Marinobacter caseinilyticus]|uniref:LLM class oxidoreductase n=1 Tax=Marinobacter caseinilyticus TaxID=2692195 RepID=UPI00140BBA91|nr:LLM class oxidoreductase [Marinobacter caseinilyticus]
MNHAQSHPSLLSAPTNAGFRRMFEPRKLTCGLFFPIAAYASDMPVLDDQTALAARADQAGFAALWTRDVPLRDPNFGDVGQIMDPWVWMTYMLPHVKHAALATGSLILPLRHPIHLAKAAASLDALSGGRLVMGLASGDRAIEFPAFGVDHHQRGDHFREAFRYLEALLGETYPILRTSLGELSGADLVPKPVHGRLPLGVTGAARQSPAWVAEHADFWLTHPRPLPEMARVMANWRQSVHEAGAHLEKPVAQSLYIDLAEDPDTSPKPIHLGYRLGRNWLIQLLGGLQEIGVNHVGFILRYSRRPADEVVDELAREVVPVFPAHSLHPKC